MTNKQSQKGGGIKSMKSCMVKGEVTLNAYMCSSKNSNFNLLTVREFNNFMKNINIRKETRPAKIPPKASKLTANVIHSHLTNIINNDLIQKFIFRASENYASVRPLFKNYGPVNILNCFSKIYEIILHG